MVSSSIRIDHALIKGNLFFDNAIFNKSVIIRDSYFNGEVDLGNSAFNGHAEFGNSIFNGDANFWHSAFSGDADFSDSAFNGEANFIGSVFNSSADFGNLSFNGNAIFGSSTFNDEANFIESVFNGNAAFDHTDFSGFADFQGSTFNNSAVFVGSAFNGTADFEDSVLNNSKFFSAEFNKPVYFNDANFTNSASFNGSRFKEDSFFEGALFDGILYLTRTKYDTLNLRWSSIHDLAYDDTAYHLLIQNFNKLGFTDDARECQYSYRCKHREELFRQHKFDSWLFDLLAWATYGYGLRPVRPLGWAALFILIGGLFFFLTGSVARSKETHAGKKPLALRKREEKLEGGISIYEALLLSAIYFTSGASSIISATPAEFVPVGRGRYVVVILRLLGWIFFVLFLSSLTRTV